MNDDYYQSTNQPANTPPTDQPQPANSANQEAGNPPVQPTDFTPPAPPPISQDMPEEKPAEMTPAVEPEPAAEPQPAIAEPAIEEPKPTEEIIEPAAEPEAPAAFEPTVEPAEAKPEEAAAKTPPEAAREAKTPAEAYDIFVDELLKDLGFEKLEEPRRSELIDAIKLRVEARVLRVLITSLTKEQAEEFEQEIEEKELSQEETIKLLSEKSPNSSAAVLSALDDLYVEMKEETELLWKVAAAQSVAEGAQKVEDQKPEDTASSSPAA
jgi:fused signal recognition particle receptor